VHDWKDRLANFAETAHVLRQLDLVITVDTAVAHLAGALNKPTWLLLPQNADFRWLRQRSDSPWYPSMRLFRQTAHGDWSSVAAQLDQAFDTLLLLDTKQLLNAKMA
jgi:ADP-heptose:LPS heptosyltransferase